MINLFPNLGGAWSGGTTSRAADGAGRPRFMPWTGRLYHPRAMAEHSLMKKASLVPLAAGAVIAAQVLHASRRRDLPSLTNQDPSGEWGDRGLPPLRIVALGDSSITAPGVEPLDDAWVRRVAIDLSTDWRVELCSVAIGGTRASDMLADQVDRAAGLQPGLALIAVGANDAIRATSLQRFEAEVTAILSRMSVASCAVVTLGVGDLGTIPRLPRTLAGALTRRGRLVNDATRRAAEGFPNVYAVNPWETMTELSARDIDLWAADQFHASGEGHAIFYRGAILTIRSALAV